MHCIQFLRFLSIFYFTAGPPLFWGNWIHCHPFWICIFASLWSHLICFHIPHISCRVQASSRSLFDMGSSIWVRIHTQYRLTLNRSMNHTGGLILYQFGRHVVGFSSHYARSVGSSDISLACPLPISHQSFLFYLSHVVLSANCVAWISYFIRS